MVRDFSIDFLADREDLERSRFGRVHVRASKDLRVRNLLTSDLKGDGSKRLSVLGLGSSGVPVSETKSGVSNSVSTDSLGAGAKAMPCSFVC